MIEGGNHMAEAEAGRFDFIFVSADHFLFYVVLNVCSQYSVHQALLRSRFEINKAWNKLCGHDRNYGTIPIFLLIFFCLKRK